MPHKHKRKAEYDENNFDLPPSVRAAPLPVGKNRPAPAPKSKKRKTNHVQGYGTDDTPKAFARLMAFQTSGKRRSGLDDGVKPKKGANKPQQQQSQQKQQLLQHSQRKEAVATEQEALPNSEEQVVETPKLKIMPGESLAEFRQRVNQALPLSGVSKTGKKISGLGDHRVTKHERHLKRLQEGWRKEEARIRDREQEAAELAEEENDELEAMWEDKTAELPTSGSKKKGKKGKKRLVVGEVDDGAGDEWEVLRRKREEGKRKGLHDVVQEPPSFERVPREIFKVKNGAKVNVDNVPSKVGSLRKREELGQERQGIIETYRAMMAAKREG